MPRSSPSTLKHRRSRSGQRGLVTAIAVLILIATVVVALTQMLNQDTGNQVQVQHHGESDKAFFIAESGLEAARQRLAILLGARFTNASCTGLISTFSNVALGDGRYSVTAAVPSPTICDSAGGTPCTDCALTVVGTVGNRNRSITYGVNLSATNGVACDAYAGNCTNTGNPLNWRLNLTNTYATNSVAVFSLAARRQGNFTTANCAAGAPCNLQWYVQAQNGGSSVGSMGNAVVLGPDGSANSNYLIYQTLTANFSVAEVGALFNGTGSGPSLAGKFNASGVAIEGTASYWNSPNSGSGGTVGKQADNTGWTSNGSAYDPTDTSSGGTCTTATSASAQNCENWCYAGDTLVYGFAAEASSGGESLNATGGVVFDDGGQNLSMTRVDRYSTNISSQPTGNTYSEIWYLSNPGYFSPSSAASTGATFTGSAGTTFTANFNNNSTQITISAISSGGVITVGDALLCGGANCPGFGAATIAAVPGGGTSSSSSGSYTISVKCNNPGCGNSVAAGVATNKLYVTALGFGQTLGVGDVVSSTGAAPNITAGTTITAVPGGGSSSSTINANYTISTAQLVSSRPTMSVASANVRVTGATTAPAAGTLLAVRSGTGVLQSVTKVAASPAPTATSFWLDKIPTTQLSGAQLCGGTCAFFRQGSGVTTPFRIVKSAGTGYWSSGFTCLKGANVTPEVVNSATTTNRRWIENVTN